jgi:DNA-binding response OmpR family regulator
VLNDDPDLVELIGEALREEGVEAVTAVTVDAAEDALASFRPDLVIVDVLVGDGTHGLDFIRRIRADPALAHVLVVAMSGSTPDLAKTRATAHATLEKPFARATLLETLATLYAA